LDAIDESRCGQARLAGAEAAGRHAHLSPLWGGEWAAWRWVCVRGAGFPASGVLALGAEACAAAADRAVRAESDAAHARRRALEELERQRAGARPGDEPERHDPLVRVARRVRKGRLPEHSEAAVLPPEAAAAVERLRAACEQADDARAEYEREFGAASVAASRRIREVAADERFREAVLWQNRRALHTGLDALLRMPLDARPSKQQRHYERLVATYLQRYCVKNDTIGFFGPVGWARVVPGARRIEVSAGENFLAARTVYFEGWALDELVRACGSGPALLPWIAPRRSPFVDVNVEAQMLYVPAQRPTRLPAPLIAALSLCDGERTARDVASELLARPSAGFREEGQVYQVLVALRDRGLISWSPEMSWTPNAPSEWGLEANLRRLLRRVGDADARRPLEEALAEMERGRDEVADAADDAVRLDAALGRLEQKFFALTGAGATRSAGETYAGRTLVYEDCRRDLDVELSEQLLAELGEPLSLLLQSARWFTYEAARAYRLAFRRVYDDLARRGGGADVDAVSFWRGVQPLLFGERQRAANEVVAEFRRRWAEVLRLPEGTTRAEYEVAELRPRVQALFDAPRAGWQSARYHSPDVMVAAGSVEAIRRGDFLFVMGELHMGVNTLGNLLFLGQHPTPADLFRALEADAREPRLVPLLPKSWPGLTTRTRSGLVSAKDYRLELSADAPGPPGARVVPIGSLLIEEQRGQLYAVTRDRRLRFEIVEAFGDALSSITANDFRPLASLPHSPRVTVGRLVLARETWRTAAQDIGFAFEKGEAERFLGARRWASSLGLPRFAFARAAVEIKPLYVDFASPVYVEALAKLVRRAAEAAPEGLEGARVTLSEMLPGPGQFWLEDSAGRRYTSELRIAALDLAG
jgi:hypothetical protein